MDYSGHDVERLLASWVCFAEKKGWHRHDLGSAGNFPVFALLNDAAESGREGGLYLSTGVHGDECAPPWALLRWAESDPTILTEVPIFAIPCFNPLGLLENTRRDEAGVDLNRNFQNPELPLIAKWQEFLVGRRFRMSLHLHEDYDATGIYLYEIARKGSLGDSFLSACEELIPRETYASVDGSELENGLLHHNPEADDLHRIVEEDLDGGMPEAIYLYLHHTQNSFTFETPSEFDLTRRIAAHQRFLETVSICFRQAEC